MFFSFCRKLKKDEGLKIRTFIKHQKVLNLTTSVVLGFEFRLEFNCKLHRYFTALVHASLLRQKHNGSHKIAGVFEGSLCEIDRQRLQNERVRSFCLPTPSYH